MSEQFFGIVEGDFAHFDDHEKAHMKVMRIKVGNEIKIMDGNGTLFRGKLINADSAVVEEIIKKERPDRTKIHVILSPIKWERLRFAVEKATELGVTTIVLANMDRTTRMESESKLKKVSFVVRDAMKQSGILYMPEVKVLEQFDLTIKAGKFIFDTKGESMLKETFHEEAEIIFVFGPEGGFTDRERSFFKSSGFEMAKLWKYTLRTETAVVYAISTVRTLESQI